KVSLTLGQTLTLTCTVSRNGPIGPMKWLKGWASGHETIYSDFSIRIRDVQPEDTGTYYCVKFDKSVSGLKGFQHGKGTEVSVHASPLVPGMVAAAVVLCFLLLLGLLIILCIYKRKQRGDSQCQARTVTVGSLSPIMLPCCARTSSTPSEILDAETKHLPSQQNSNESNDIHILPTAPWHGNSPDTACSEDATVRTAVK
ncbi:SHPS1 phosphatase, partial [Upupa epops]|nr:SHPS1 phosphatase [Upupa epops]